MTVPCATSDELPLGLVLTGLHFNENTVLRAAYAFEQPANWHRQPGPDMRANGAI